MKGTHHAWLMVWISLFWGCTVTRASLTLSQRRYSRAVNDVDALQTKKLSKTYLSLEGEQCSLLTNVQSSLLELYSNDNKCNQNLNNLHKSVKQLEKRMDSVDESMTRMKHEARYQAAEARKESPVSGAGAVGKDHMTSADAQQMVMLNNRRQKMVSQMIKNTERKTSSMVRDIDRRTNYNFKLIGRKMQNIQQQFNSRIDNKRDGHHMIHKIRMENRKREQEIRRQKGVINDLKDRLDWMERAMEKVVHSSYYLYQHDDPQTTVEIPTPPNACPVGFIRNAMSCYKFENASLNWEEAERYCLTYGSNSHLVSVETKMENDFIISVRKYNEAKWSSEFLWTGGHDTIREGQWKWVGTGKYVAFSYWRDDEPNGGKKQNCMYYTGDKGHRWDDWNCLNTKMNFVCEITLELKSKIKADPSKKDHKKNDSKSKKGKKGKQTKHDDNMRNKALDSLVKKFFTEASNDAKTPKATKPSDTNSLP